MSDLKEKLVELLREEYKYATYEDMADGLIANGVTIQKWIPVSERLPNKDEYTAKAKDGEEYYKWILIAYKTDTVEYEIGYYDGYKWLSELPMRIIKDVVAWMPFFPMPQPPKGE